MNLIQPLRGSCNGRFACVCACVCVCVCLRGSVGVVLSRVGFMRLAHADDGHCTNMCMYTRHVVELDQMSMTCSDHTHSHNTHLTHLHTHECMWCSPCRHQEETSPICCSMARLEPGRRPELCVCEWDHTPLTRTPNPLAPSLSHSVTIS